MDRYGILVNYDYCCGCHTCEVACQKEHGYGIGQWGVKVAEVGPFKVEGSKKTVYDCFPVMTDLCDHCAERTAKGKLPTCVHHCQTGCLAYGLVDELASRMVPGNKCAIISAR